MAKVCYSVSPNPHHPKGRWPMAMTPEEAALYTKWYSCASGKKAGIPFRASWKPKPRKKAVVPDGQRKAMANARATAKRRRNGAVTREEHLARLANIAVERRFSRDRFGMDHETFGGLERQHNRWWSVPQQPIAPERLAFLANPALFMWCLTEVARPILAECRRRKRESKRVSMRKPGTRTFLSARLRRRLASSIKTGKGLKSGTSRDIIGCSWGDLRAHIECQFKPGMSWENYGYYGWHIDHIRPLAVFDLADPAQVRDAWNYKNLQPLWAHENYDKSSRLALEAVA